MTLVVGIDPGGTGAIAFFRDGEFWKVEDLPILHLIRNGKERPEIDGDLVADMLDATPAIDHAFVEHIWGFPTRVGKDGKTAARSPAREASLLIGYGVIKGILHSQQIPRTFVAPVRWKKALAVTAAKDGCRARASQLLPEAAGNWRRVKDHNRAEAALIGLYGLRFGGLGS